jgi:hypothetical protein
LFGFRIYEWFGEGHGLGLRRGIGESGLVLMGIGGSFTLETLTTGRIDGTEGVD